MKLYIIACLFQLAAMTSSSKALDRQPLAVTCGTFLSMKGGSANDRIIDAIGTRLGSDDNAGRFGSTCNMIDYVNAICKANKSFTLRHTLGVLEELADRKRLPSIPMCGA